MLDSHESKLHQLAEDQCRLCVSVCVRLGGTVGRIDARDLQLKAILLAIQFPW